MAATKKSSTKASASRTRSSAGTKSAKTTSKPSGPKQLHKSAQKQTTAVARGRAGQEKPAKGRTSAKATPVRDSKTKGRSLASKAGGKLKAAGKAIRRTAGKVTSALGEKKTRTSSVARAGSAARSTPMPARKPRRVSDVDVAKLDDISAAQGSSKGPFDAKRSDAPLKQDIESALLNRNDEWRDEDHFTNKSGDKRIGTKNRKYE